LCCRQRRFGHIPFPADRIAAATNLDGAFAMGVGGRSRGIFHSPPDRKVLDCIRCADEVMRWGGGNSSQALAARQLGRWLPARSSQ
jgi:hypothetical protein